MNGDERSGRRGPADGRRRLPFYDAQRATRTGALREVTSPTCSSYEEMEMGGEKAPCSTDE